MLPELSQINTTNNTDTTSDSLSKTLEKNDLISRDAFLRLFIEQLKNQDPLNPMENYELSAQLAQFSSLEQLYNINKNFQDFQNLLNRTTYIQGINLIGKKVLYEGNEIYKSGTSPVEIKFNLDEDAITANINIYDENNNLVKTIEAKDLTKGENSVTWDGTNIEGNQANNGIYRYEVVAYNNEGDTVDYTGYASGLITSLRFDPDTNNALFKVNNDEITIDKIISISSDNYQSQDTNETEDTQNQQGTDNSDTSNNTDSVPSG